jgi:hypothetical protein
MTAASFPRNNLAHLLVRYSTLTISRPNPFTPTLAQPTSDDLLSARRPQPLARPRQKITHRAVVPSPAARCADAPVARSQLLAVYDPVLRHGAAGSCSSAVAGVHVMGARRDRCDRGPEYRDRQYDCQAALVYCSSHSGCCFSYKRTATL